jgi:hypothetical protein
MVMETVKIEVPEEQLINWVKKLSPASKQEVLRVLIPELDELEALVDYGDQRIRAICAERGIDWNALNDEERQRLIDEILHQD